MAFRQHHRPQRSKQLTFPLEVPQPTETESLSPVQPKNTADDSEEWVLFSPAAPSTTNTFTSDRTPRTAGLSRLSDFGSLETAAHSFQGEDEDDEDNFTYPGVDPDDGELDSLDDGLHAFHEPSEHGSAVGKMLQSGDTVLPTHDGLGTFPTNRSLVEAQLWQFERQRPRHPRRRSSVQRRLEALQATDEVHEIDERRQRIEKWRIDQSLAFLEEIEKETRRRRRMSTVSASRKSVAHSATGGAAQSVIEETQPQQVTAPTEQEKLSILQRITRRLIQGLMGIDDSVLSVICGESLPEDISSSVHRIPKDPLQTLLEEENMSSLPADSWERKLLERIAREFGIVVNQLSDHPGAFSTYTRVQETPEYAGLSSTSSATPSTIIQAPSIPIPPPGSPTTEYFKPTLANQSPLSYSDVSLWGIEEEPEPLPVSASYRPQSLAEETRQLQQEREYWEQELDVKMVFNFLKRRFSSRSPSPEPPSTTSHNQRIPSHYQDNQTSARRAALIRQNHPLVSRATAENRKSHPSGNNSFSQLPHTSRRRELHHRHHHHHHHHHHHFPSTSTLRSGPNVLRAGGSSCASQSTKKSKRSGGSGRNYWDLGDSVGSGPAERVGGIGVWGEA